MRAELPTVSFFCVAALVLVAPLFASSRNFPVLSLAAWLICCNIIHGVNTIIWAGNDAIHVPVWCDIVTRILLAAQIAIPGSALALVLRLRRCALGQDTSRGRSPTTPDVMLCLILPILYMILYIIQQPHRFDIATDFGCVVSIYTSSLSIIFIWIPPLLLCIAIFVFGFLSIRARLGNGLFFFSHMQDAPRLSALAFIRPLVISVSTCLISFAVTIFSMTAHLISVGGLQAWTVETWAQVHAEMSQIFVIPANSTLVLRSIQAEWWTVPAYTFVFVLMTGLAVVSGAHAEGSRTYEALPRWLRRTFLRRTPDDPFAQAKGFGVQTLSSSPSSPTSMYEMKSGWNDSWRPAAPAQVKLPPLTIPSASSESTIAVNEHDDPFARSTMQYIESPTGREALGLPPLPPALYLPTARNGSVSPPVAPVAPARSPSPPQPRASSPTEDTSQARPDSMVLSGSWPRPPSTIPTSPRTPSPKNPVTVTPPSPAPSSARAPSPTPRPPSIISFTSSVASPTVSMSGYVRDEPHDVPFQDSAASNALGPGLAVPKHIRKVRSRDVLLPRSLSVSSRAKRNGSDGGLSGGIYMTVVRETE
ncbi:pheromone A receptor-domain-containing protein [Trametes punicea]|nr:pheromone A receptor-domain-containing protein [Trametes punicea]